jgi:hypothetical protein
MTSADAAGTWNLYVGDEPDAIDLDCPVASAPASQSQLGLNIEIPPGGRKTFLLRRVSPGGAEERNTHVLAMVAVDDNGELIPPSPARLREVSAEVRPDGMVIVHFTYLSGANSPAPTSFELLRDVGGMLDTAHSLASVPFQPSRSEYEISAVVALPARLAVRAMSGPWSGLPSETVAVFSPAEPPTAVIF